MKSDWLTILQNEKQLLVHSRTVNNDVAGIRAAHNVLVSRKDAKRKDMEYGPKRMRKDEQCMQDLVICMQECDSNKGRLQKFICSFLTDLAPSVDAEVIYSVGPHCTNTATDSEHADNVLFSAYAVQRESCYTGPVVIDVAALDAYVRAAVTSQQLPGMLCIKRKQEKIYCRGLVADKMPDCIVQLHCDAISGFYGKGKKSVYDQVAKSPLLRRQLSRCGESLDLEEEMVEQLFEFTRHVIYGDNKSSTIAEPRAAKWKRM